MTRDPDRRTETYNLLLTSILAVCAVVLTIFIIATHVAQRSQPDTQSTPAAKRVVVAAQQYHSAGHLIGNPAAPSIITVFTDFECPFCRALWQNIKQSTAYRSGVIAVRVRHYPLQRIHPSARRAAVIAECAARQGRFPDAFEAMMAGANTDNLETFSGYIGIIAADSFHVCVTEQRTDPLVAADIEAGQRLMIVGVPALLVADTLMSGVVTASEIDGIAKHAQIGG